MTSEHWIVYSGVVSAIASALNVILVGVLAWITWRYTKSTTDILEESRKARQAAELQVIAANSQASAAQAQATAAYETLTILKQQIEDQLGLGHGIVQGTVQSAVARIEYWRTQDIERLAILSALPPTDGLVPDGAKTTLEHARRISGDGANLLSSAFDSLQLARNEIDSIRAIIDVPVARAMGLFKSASSQAHGYLQDAFEKIQKAQALLL